MSTITAQQVDRTHLDRPIAFTAFTDHTGEEAARVEGTLRWFSHITDLVQLAVENPLTGLTEGWQVDLTTPVVVAGEARSNTLRDLIEEWRKGESALAVDLAWPASLAKFLSERGARVPEGGASNGE